MSAEQPTPPVDGPAAGRSHQDITTYNPSTLPPPHGFSRSVAADGVLWVSGHIARGSDGAIVGPGDLAAQYRQALRNVSATLDAAGCSPGDLLKITYFVTDVKAYQEHAEDIEAIVDAFLAGSLPAATLVGVTGLLLDDAMVEVECQARHRPSMPA